MGETGVGKTKIFEMLSTLYGKGELNWRKLEIHAGITDEDIVDFIETIIKEDNELNKDIKEDDRRLVWVFFDEINTCNSLGLITEIMCRHTYLGKKINSNFVFFGACNPYRVLNKKMKYREIKELNEEKNALNRKLMQIIENENLLEGKNKNNSELLVEQNLKEKIKKENYTCKTNT